MNIEVREAIFSQIEKWVYEAGMLIRQKMNQPFVITTKSGENDLVTEVDREIEAYLTREIRAAYPTHYVVSEEGYGDDEIDKEGTVWLIDPIDGTTNFIHQKRNFAISIGVYHARIGEIGFIYDVNADVLYSAKKGEGAYKNGVKLEKLSTDKKLTESMISLNHYWLMDNQHYDREVMQELLRKVRGTRTFGSAALEFAFVAEGAIDAYFKKRLEPWDIAAGMIIVNEVGGMTTNLFGDEVDIFKAGSVLTSNVGIHHILAQEYLQKAKK